MYEKVGNSTAWAGKPKFVKIYSSTENLEERCASAAYSTGKDYFSIVTNPRGLRKCATFSYASSPCMPGQRTPLICRQTSTGAYKLKKGS